MLEKPEGMATQKLFVFCTPKLMLSKSFRLTAVFRTDPASALRIVCGTIHYTMRAKKIVSSKTRYPDGSIMEIHIWQLPQPTADRPHGFKFRLNYSLPDGSTLVRFDNERRKGDHKHIKSVEMPYEFSSPEQVINDFRADILKHGGQL